MIGGIRICDEIGEVEFEVVGARESRKEEERKHSVTEASKLYHSSIICFIMRFLYPNIIDMSTLPVILAIKGRQRHAPCCRVFQPRYAYEIPFY